MHLGILPSLGIPEEADPVIKFDEGLQGQLLPEEFAKIEEGGEGSEGIEHSRSKRQGESGQQQQRD